MIARLQTATRVPVAAGVGAGRGRDCPKPLLPLAVVTDFLQGSALVKNMGVPVADVYAAIVALRARRAGGGEDAPPTVAPQTVATPVPPECLECTEGRVVVDAHEGTLVCTRCGLQQVRGRINIDPEFVAAPQLSGKRPNYVPGVPGYMLIRPIVRRTFWKDLEHWNAWANLGTDDLARADEALCEWSSDGGHSKIARVAAVLLSRELDDRFPTEANARELMRRGMRLPQVNVQVPPPRFRCGTCDAGCHSAKDARLHCRVGGKRRWGA